MRAKLMGYNKIASVFKLTTVIASDSVFFDVTQSDYKYTVAECWPS